MTSPARLEVARQLAGMAETYANEVTDHYTRQALGHLIAAVRELAQAEEDKS
jgi:hypothetical protein